MTERTVMNECYLCMHRRGVPGDAHIACNKPDPLMTGQAHGVAHGWFFYPYVFDPVWKTKLCANWEPPK